MSAEGRQYTCAALAEFGHSKERTGDDKPAQLTFTDTAHSQAQYLWHPGILLQLVSAGTQVHMAMLLSTSSNPARSTTAAHHHIVIVAQAADRAPSLPSRPRIALQ